MNLANLPFEQRQAIQADLIACRLRHEMRAKTMKTSDWQAFVRTELERLPPEMAALVKQELKVRAGK